MQKRKLSLLLMIKDHITRRVEKEAVTENRKIDDNSRRNRPLSPRRTPYHLVKNSSAYLTVW